MRVSIDGVSLFFDVEGCGLAAVGPKLIARPTLLLLHGSPGVGDLSNFKPLFTQLADVAQLIYLDLRGSGRSDAGPVERLTISQWADDVASFCSALGIERPIVLGQSAGGFIAIQYAARYPENISKLILGSTQARVTPERIIAAVRRRCPQESVVAAEQWLADPLSPERTAAWRKHVVLPYYNFAPPDPDYAARTITRLEAWWPLARAWYIAREDLTPLLPAIRCPTLLLHGEDDLICPVQDAEDILAALPPGIGQLRRFERCGHGVWRDHPERAIATIREFIAS